MNSIFKIFRAMCIGIILSAFVFMSCEKDNNRSYNNTSSGNNSGGGNNNSVVDPIDSFSFSPAKPIAPCTVNFSNTSSGNPTNYQWELSDGQTFNSKNINITYNSAGLNTITKNIKIYSDCEANNYGWIRFYSTSNYSYDIYILTFPYKLYTTI